MLKTKILKVLPFWLMFLCLALAGQGAGLLLSPGPNSISAPQAEAQSPVPEVLGASTQIRGEEPAPQPPIKEISRPDLSSINAKSLLVFDLNSGQTLLQKNSDKKLGIASLTKLLTGLTVYKNTDLNQTFGVPAKSVMNVRPILGLRAGEQVNASDLFNAMLVGSCNDAAEALAGFASEQTGADFVSLMNAQAAALGMANSHFSNPLGFDSVSNYSTAEDLKTLIAAVEKLAVFTNLGRRTSYDFKALSGTAYSTTATNQLLKNHPDLFAIKTGYTENSGGAMATKAEINGREIVIIVLGSSSREADTLQLKDQITANFSW